MKLFEMGPYNYKKGNLYCEQVPIENIVQSVGTPLFIYSKKYLVDQYLGFDEAFKGLKHSIYFSVKSNFNLNVIKTFLDLGSGADVNSGGEFFRALKAGANPNKISLASVGKSSEEIRMGLEKGVKVIKAESFSEIKRINEIANEMGRIAHVAIRINPDIDAKTHPHISTGLAENKFGIESSRIEEIFLECMKLDNIRPVGIDMHIGSQITSIEPYVEAIKRMAVQFNKIKYLGIPLEHFDIGGGIGIQYSNEKVFTPAQLAEKIKDLLNSLNCEIIFEPGRFLTANSGILVTEIQYIKKNGNKVFYIIDAGMTELLRPALYNAYHHIQPVKLENRKDVVTDIVGPICESSDYFAKDREIAECKEGEKLAVMSAGAYSNVMSSNYNARRRPPEIMVDGEKFFVTRNRETYEHLIWDEKIISELHTK
jgi:diaminopimelate decarboxylase